MLTIALVDLLLLGAIAAIVFFTLRDERPDGQADRVTLAMPATDGPPESTDGDIITHLSITGGAPEQVDMSLYLTDMEDRNLMPDPAFTATVDLTNLSSGATAVGLDMSPVAGSSTPTFILDEPGMKSEGWWHVQATIERPDGNPLESNFYILLPDPNIAGFQAPPTPDSDPAAAQMLTTAITQMGEWVSLRWWEWLSGGNDSLIMANYAVTTTEGNGQPNSFRTDMIYGGGFERRSDGAPPAAPARNHFTQVTIGDQAWSRDEKGARGVPGCGPDSLRYRGAGRWSSCSDRHLPSARSLGTVTGLVSLLDRHRNRRDPEAGHGREQPLHVLELLGHQ